MPPKKRQKGGDVMTQPTEIVTKPTRKRGRPPKKKDVEPVKKSKGPTNYLDMLPNEIMNVIYEMVDWNTISDVRRAKSKFQAHLLGCPGNEHTSRIDCLDHFNSRAEFPTRKAFNLRPICLLNKPETDQIKLHVSESAALSLEWVKDKPNPKTVAKHKHKETGLPLTFGWRKKYQKEKEGMHPIWRHLPKDMRNLVMGFAKDTRKEDMERHKKAFAPVSGYLYILLCLFPLDQAFAILRDRLKERHAD